MASTTLGLVMEQLMAPRFTAAIARNHGDETLEQAAKYFGRSNWDDPTKAAVAADFIEEAGGDPGVIRLLEGAPEYGGGRVESAFGVRHAVPIDPNQPIPTTRLFSHEGRGYLLDRPRIEREERPLAIGPTVFSAPEYGMSMPVEMQASRLMGPWSRAGEMHPLPFSISKQPQALGEMFDALAGGDIPWRVGYSGPVDAAGRDLAERVSLANYGEGFSHDDYLDAVRALAEWEYKNPVVDIPRYALARPERGPGPLDLDLSVLG